MECVVCVYIQACIARDRIGSDCMRARVVSVLRANVVCAATRCAWSSCVAVLILHAVGVVVVVVAQGAREGADVLARERIDGDASNIS